jgi:hypothetical protein
MSAQGTASFHAASGGSPPRSVIADRAALRRDLEALRDEWLRAYSLGPERKLALAEYHGILDAVASLEPISVPAREDDFDLDSPEPERRAFLADWRSEAEAIDAAALAITMFVAGAIEPKVVAVEVRL